jgi:hypothetical protein
MSEHNMKERLLWCPKCNMYALTNEPNSKCERLIIPIGSSYPVACGETLITVLYSIITGQQLTGMK